MGFLMPQPLQLSATYHIDLIGRLLVEPDHRDGMLVQTVCCLYPHSFTEDTSPATQDRRHDFTDYYGRSPEKTGVGLEAILLFRLGIMAI